MLRISLPRSRNNFAFIFKRQFHHHQIRRHITSPLTTTTITNHVLFVGQSIRTSTTASTITSRLFTNKADNKDETQQRETDEQQQQNHHVHKTRSERWMERLMENLKPLESRIRASATFNDVSSLLDEMERRKYNYRRYLIGGVAFALWFFYDSFTRFFSNRAADVTKQYLENPEFKRDIVTFINSPEIQSSAKALVSSVINDKALQTQLQQMLSDVVQKTIADEKLREGICELFHRIDFVIYLLSFKFFT